MKPPWWLSERIDAVIIGGLIAISVVWLGITVCATLRAIR